MRSNSIFIFLIFISFCGCNQQSPSETHSEEKKQEELLNQYSLDELYAELKLRVTSKNASIEEDSIPPYFSINKKFSNYSNNHLFNAINNKQIAIFKKLYSPPIYDLDDRKDLFHIKDPEVFKNGVATCCIVDKNNISSQENQYFLNGQPTDYCQNERFSNQKKLANCTAFAISTNILITAGHCIDQINFNNYAILYSYYNNNPEQAFQEKTDKNNIYQIKEVLRNVTLPNGTDFAVLKIDRPVPKNLILKVRKRGKVEDNAKLYATGYPDGLPLKIATNGRIRNNQISNFFVTNLDTFKGNSGSPVFDSLTHEVEGILVRGETDFIQDGNCKKLFLCKSKDCNGEEVIRISELMPYIEKYISN